jgi:fatty acid/phospholipid biosynthesis enzyme
MKKMNLPFDRVFNGKNYGIVSWGDKVYTFNKAKAKSFIKHIKARDKSSLSRIIPTKNGKYVIYTWWKGRIGNLR